MRVAVVGARASCAVKARETVEALAAAVDALATLGAIVRADGALAKVAQKAFRALAGARGACCVVHARSRA